MQRYLLIIICCFINMSANAVVVRHDVDKSKYLATVNDFPALATFYIDGAHGTLIKPRWVLTAAHTTFCLAANKKIKVNGKLRAIKQVYVHKDYTPGESHDIALIELVTDIDDVRPAHVYKKQNELGKQVWFIGIGGTGNGLTGQTIDNWQNGGVLRKAQNTVGITQGALLSFTFNQGEEALPLEGVSGGGDSGGPAYIKTPEGYQLLGISSRADGIYKAIGEYGITEIYTRVSYFQKWVSDIISGYIKLQKQLSTNKLHSLPAGLTANNLASVCNSIALSK